MLHKAERYSTQSNHICLAHSIQLIKVLDCFLRCCVKNWTSFSSSLSKLEWTDWNWTSLDTQTWFPLDLLPSGGQFHQRIYLQLLLLQIPKAQKAVELTVFFALLVSVQLLRAQMLWRSTFIPPIFMRPTLPSATTILYAQLLPYTLNMQLLRSTPLSVNLLAEKAACKTLMKLTPGSKGSASLGLSVLWNSLSGVDPTKLSFFRFSDFGC